MDQHNEIIEEAKKISDFELFNSSDIPRIELYMEQVIQFLDQELGDALRKEGEPIFTNTMINNYTKEGVMPRPDNKRYNKRHIMTLIYIFILKHNLSLSEIKEFTKQIDSDNDLEKMYNAFRDIIADYQPIFMEEIQNKMALVEKRFKEQKLDNEKMTIMTLITLISYEITLGSLLSSALLKPDNYFLNEKKEASEEENPEEHKKEQEK